MPTPLDPISPVNSPLRIWNETPSRIGPAGKGDADVLDLEDGGVDHRCSVDVPCTTALLIAATSATIQDW